MASERQVAANRRNARKSTGPRSGAGKKRASGNAYRHGFSVRVAPNIGRIKQAEELAHDLAKGSSDQTILCLARSAALAEIDVREIRRAKVATINLVLALGEVAPPPSKPLMRFIGRNFGKITPIDARLTMPVEKPARTAEAVRRAMPELIKLDRYERRAVSRRDRCIRQIVARRRWLEDGRNGPLAKRSQFYFEISAA